MIDYPSSPRNDKGILYLPNDVTFSEIGFYVRIWRFVDDEIIQLGTNFTRSNLLI